MLGVRCPAGAASLTITEEPARPLEAQTILIEDKGSGTSLLQDHLIAKGRF